MIEFHFTTPIIQYICPAKNTLSLRSRDHIMMTIGKWFWRCGVFVFATQESFECGKPDDHDWDCHLGHGPYEDGIPVIAELDCDEAGEIDGDRREADCEGQ